MKKLLGIILIISITTSVFSEKTTPFRKYYGNGNPKILGFHLDRTRQKHGEWTYYFEDGKLKEIGSYKHGKREGEWKRYHENGKLSSSGSYKDGKEDGEFKTYWGSGELYKIGSYKDGKKVGEWKSYRQDGKVSKIGNYENGKFHSPKISN